MYEEACNKIVPLSSLLPVSIAAAHLKRLLTCIVTTKLLRIWHVSITSSGLEALLEFRPHRSGDLREFRVLFSKMKFEVPILYESLGA